MSSASGRVVAVCAGPGGIPKPAVESAAVTVDGLAGDGHRFKLHGGRKRAVCLFSVEDYASLRRDGVAADPPGAFGENLTIEGLAFDTLRAGDRLRVGAEVELEITDIREPCGTLKSIDERFPNLMVGRSGFVCSVVNEGQLQAGMNVTRV